MSVKYILAGAGAVAGVLGLTVAALAVRAGAESTPAGAVQKPPAAAQACPSKPTQTANVASVRDGDTLVLSDGRLVRLTGIQAPKLALGRAGLKDWPIGPEAKDALSTLIGTGPIGYASTAQATDRNGRQLAQVFTSGGAWVQGEMVRRGFARVYTWEDNRGCGPALLKLEQAARTAKVGLWANAFYRIRSAADAEADLESFQIVEGTVLSTANVRGRTYLNFGIDYRTDFTVTVLAADAARFAGSRVDLLALKGQSVRVRGWLKSRNGPEIRVTHPEQIERIASQPAAALVR